MAWIEDLRSENERRHLRLWRYRVGTILQPGGWQDACKVDVEAGSSPPVDDTRVG